MQEAVLFIMSLSGTVVFFLYVLTYKTAKKYFTISWRYTILKVSLAFYLIPFPLLKFIIFNYFYVNFPDLSSSFISVSSGIDITEYILVSKYMIIIPWKVKLIWLFAFINAFISLSIICLQLSKYYRFKKRYLRDDLYSVPSYWEKEFRIIKEALGVKGDVKLVFSQYCEVPLAVGVFSPTVIMPVPKENQLLDENWMYMLKHELNHIKNKDLLIRVLTLIAMAFHWFNPICYFLYYEICNISETNCDFCTIAKEGERERKRYSNLVVDMATEYREERGRKYFVRLVNHYDKSVERRILEMKSMGNKRKVFLSYLVGGVICFAGGITALAAYSPPPTYQVEETGEIELYDAVKFERLEDTDVQGKVEKIPYDCFWTGEDGKTHEIRERDSDEKVHCSHQFVEGVITTHKVKSDNSCTVAKRKAKECSLCGSIVEGSIISTTNYTVCPH